MTTNASLLSVCQAVADIGQFETCEAVGRLTLKHRFNVSLTDSIGVRMRDLPDDGPAIALRRLTKTYRGHAAVDDVTLEIPRGSVCGLLGGNGAGKTTTIGMIMGLILPSSGEARVLGADMATDRHRVLGRMNFESPYVDMPHRLTVRQNLDVFARLYGLKDRRARVAALGTQLSLDGFMDRPAGALSAGQKTRVALAKALLNSPDVLLLDEPTASLDPDTADWVRGLIEDDRRARGTTILLASHNMAEVERLCDRVVVMKTGRIVADGTAASLKARFGRDTLEEVFLDVARGTGDARDQETAA